MMALFNCDLMENFSVPRWASPTSIPSHRKILSTPLITTVLTVGAGVALHQNTLSKAGLRDNHSMMSSKIVGVLKKK